MVYFRSFSGKRHEIIADPARTCAWNLLVHGTRNSGAVVCPVCKGVNRPGMYRPISLPASVVALERGRMKWNAPTAFWRLRTYKAPHRALESREANSGLPYQESPHLFAARGRAPVADRKDRVC